MHAPYQLKKSSIAQTLFLALLRVLDQTRREGMLFAAGCSTLVLFTLLTGQLHLEELRPLEGYLNTHSWVEIHFQTPLMMYFVVRLLFLGFQCVTNQKAPEDLIMVLPYVFALLVSQGWLVAFTVVFLMDWRWWPSKKVFVAACTPPDRSHNANQNSKTAPCGVLFLMACKTCSGLSRGSLSASGPGKGRAVSGARLGVGLPARIGRLSVRAIWVGGRDMDA